MSGGLSGGLKIYTENAAGNLLLMNMSDNQLDINISQTTIFPSSFSENLKNKINIKKDERGILLYKDYRTSSGLNNTTLQAYDYPSIQNSLIFSPEESTSSNMLPAGPYITAPATSDNRNSALLVMDYILDEKNKWVGVQLPINGSDKLDLSGFQSISFDWKCEGEISDIDIFVEIGSISEDLDGDSVLDEEISEFSSGYIFNDPNSENGTYIGGDNIYGNNNYKDSEDIDGNGVLDSEKIDAISFFEISDSQKPNSDWKNINLYFSNLASDFETSNKRLKDAEFIRITAVNNSTNLKDGRIIFDNFRLEGSSMYISEELDSSDITFTERLETLIPDIYAPSEKLSAITQEKDDENIVMDIEWHKENWKLFSYIKPQKVDSYNSIIFYIHTPTIDAVGNETPKFFMNLLDTEKRGIKAIFPLKQSKKWNKVEIVTATSKDCNAEVFIDDEIVNGAEIDVDTNCGNLYLLEIGAINTDHGKIFVDEIYLSSPKLRVAGGLAADFSISTSNPILEKNNVTIIGPLSFNTKASADYTENDDIISGEGSYSSYSKISTTLFFMPISFSLNLLHKDELLFSAGHDLTIPILSSLFEFSDIFFIDKIEDGNFSKTNNLNINTSFLEGIIAGFSTNLDSNQLERTWQSDLNIKANPFSMNLSTNFNLIDIDHSILSDGYFENWFNTTILIADFSEAKLKQRKTSFSISPKIAPKPVGVELLVDLIADINDDKESTNSLSASLKIPVKLDFTLVDFKGEISYERSGEFLSETSSHNFSNDIYKLFSIITKRDFLFTSIPFYELFNSELPEHVLNNCNKSDIYVGNFNNTCILKFSRKYGSNLLDLFLPYSLELSLGRETKKDYYDIEDQLDFSFEWKSSAINLFGVAGAYSLFDFYFSDEINWSFQTLIEAPSNDDTTQEYLINGGISFFGHEKDIFSFDTSLYFPVNKENEDFTMQSEIGYVWNQYPKEVLNIPYFSAEDVKNQLFTHQEKCTISIGSTFSTEIKHTTSFILPTHLTISVFGLAGYEYNGETSNNINLLGFSLGITGSIMY